MRRYNGFDKKFSHKIIGMFLHVHLLPSLLRNNFTIHYPGFPILINFSVELTLTFQIELEHIPYVPALQLG